MAEQQRCATEFYVRLVKSRSETPQVIHEAYADDAVRRAAVFKWWKRFRVGETNVKDESCSGTSSTTPVPQSPRNLRQTVCCTFSRSEWSVVRRASLAKGGASKRRPPTKFRLGVIRCPCIIFHGRSRRFCYAIPSYNKTHGTSNKPKCVFRTKHKYMRFGDCRMKANVKFSVRNGKFFNVENETKTTIL
jgi:hypothetical protein